MGWLDEVVDAAGCCCWMLFRFPLFPFLLSFYLRTRPPTPSPISLCSIYPVLLLLLLLLLFSVFILLLPDICCFLLSVFCSLLVFYFGFDCCDLSLSIPDVETLRRTPTATPSSPPHTWRNTHAICHLQPFLDVPLSSFFPSVCLFLYAESYCAWNNSAN